MKKTKAPLQAGDLVVVCKGRWKDRVKKATLDTSDRVIGVYVGKKGKKEQVAVDFAYENYCDMEKFRL